VKDLRLRALDGRSDGVVRLLGDPARQDAPCVSGSNSGRQSGDVAPRAEGPVAGSAILICGEAMTAELKVIVDAAVRGKKTLRVAGRLKALYLPLSSSRLPTLRARVPGASTTTALAAIGRVLSGVMPVSVFVSNRR
jgi:hypothetical protein